MTEYPIWATKTRANPHALYAQMRREDPVHRAIGPITGNPFWFLTRYGDCVTFLKDNRFGKGVPEMSADNPYAAIENHLLNMDPPDHTRLRALVHKAFTPRMVENLKPRIQEIADDLLDAMGKSGEANLIESYAFPLPITVIAEMLGIPPEDRDRFRAWTNSFVFGTDGAQGDRLLMEFVAYMHAQIDARHQSPRDDVLTALVQAEEDGQTLDRMELLSMIFLLLVAGHETTVNLIGNGTLALLQHPDQWRMLRDDPTLVKGAVEEILRYNGPVETTTVRWALEEADIGGTVIPKGEAVLAVLHGANHDPAVFDDPARFDITRETSGSKHIAFGSGIHYCLGAPLARLEGVIALETLVRRLPDLQLNAPAESLVWNNNILLHGLTALPVRYGMS